VEWNYVFPASTQGYKTLIEQSGVEGKFIVYSELAFIIVGDYSL